MNSQPMEQQNEKTVQLGHRVFTPYGFGTVVRKMDSSDSIVELADPPTDEANRTIPTTHIDPVGDEEWPYGTRDAIGRNR